MRLRKLLLSIMSIFLVALASSSIASTSAQAKSFQLYEATPNLVGTWHRLYSDDSFHKTIKISHHSIRLRNKTYKMYVTAHGKDHYTLHIKHEQSISVHVGYDFDSNYDEMRILKMYVGVGNSQPTDLYYKMVK
ncbi:hypothetical protein IWT25_00166 [Secundilactobacillus pentosiphilus]|uniref:Extracellular protein n=1 Tax=Secundilactobacillus pentosiphilus TaxID=1714682 RepID=A0A1Z5ITF5_9LACO|nr:hypothetical protein [Secundilactobacillus pentosiphilus]GAX04872.1 hypothetical protein IWT25_00166 [Secundilactobacillus pentosiphilus]